MLPDGASANLHDLVRVVWVGGLYYADPAQPLTTAGGGELR